MIRETITVGVGEIIHQQRVNNCVGVCIETDWLVSNINRSLKNPNIAQVSVKKLNYSTPPVIEQWTTLDTLTPNEALPTHVQLPARVDHLYDYVLYQLI